jgi:hypothetical protein
MARRGCSALRKLLEFHLGFGVRFRCPDFSLGGQVFEQLRIGFEAVIDLDRDLGRLVLDRGRYLGKARPRREKQSADAHAEEKLEIAHD